MTEALGVAITHHGDETASDRARLDQLRRTIHRTLEAGGVNAPTRPATAKLTRDQADLVVDLLGGLDTRRELLEWEQEIVIQSLGQLEDGWFTRTATDGPTVSALLGRPWGPVEEFSERIAVEIRRGIVAKDLLPAFHAAHREFRWAAVERVDHLDDDREDDAPDPIDPERQEYPLMRPAFGELEGQQQETLEALLDGFENTEALLLWTIQTTGATYAEIAPSVAQGPYFELPLREHMLNPTSGPRDRFVRESWAAEYLLPAFNRASAQLAKRATEVTARQTFRGETGGGSIT